MDNDCMERYVSFICDEIPNSKKVRISPPGPRDDGTLGYNIRPKIGPWVSRMVSVEIIEKYTRSAKIRLTFESYKDESIYFMSRHKGPDKLLSEISDKISKIVNSRLIAENRTEDIRNEYAKLPDLLEVIKIKEI